MRREQRAIMDTSSPTLSGIRPVIHLAVSTFVYFFAFVMTVPFMVDVMLGAICQGQIECSQVILMLSAQQLITGVCSIIAGPVLGGLSDDYGRKPVLVVIHLAGLVPPAILAYSRSEASVYRWWVAWIVVSIVRDSSLQSTVFAYVADAVAKSRRPAAIGLTAASSSFGLLMGTVAAYFLRTAAQAYRVSVLLHLSSALYVILFVTETNPRQPLLPAEVAQSESATKLLPKRQLRRQTTNLRQTATTVWNNPLLRVIALVDFMCIFGVVGLSNFNLYYLRATYFFDKNQLATVTLVGHFTSTVGQMIVYPVLSYAFGQRAVVWIGLFGFLGHYTFYSLSWSIWLPIIAVSMGLVSSVINPAVATISSRVVDQEMQGKLQGVLSGIRSVAGIVAPLVLTPLTAASLGENPPFNFRGLPYFVCGGVIVLSMLLSLWLPYVPVSEEQDRPSEYIQAPIPSEEFVHVPTPPEQYLHVPIHPDSKSEDSGQDEKFLA